MAQISWTPFAKAEPEKEYVAILSYLPLRSFWALPQFFYYTRRIQPNSNQRAAVWVIRCSPTCLPSDLDAIRWEMKWH